MRAMAKTVVFALALLVRIAAIELAGAETIAFGDAPDYVDAARSLCTAQTFPERGNLPFFRAPGLPFFIAGVTACEPSRTRAIKYALAICDALSVLLIFLIALRLHGSRLAAWIAAFLASLYPFFVGAVTDIRSEPLFMMLLVAAIYFALRGSPLAVGIALGLAALVRPTGLLCIPLFAIGWRFAVRPHSASLDPAAAAQRQRPTAWRYATLVVLGAVMTLAPWTIRNYARFGELIVVNDAAGFNLWRGTHRELMRIVALRDPQAFREASWRFESQTVSEAARIVDAGAKTPGARDRAWRQLALENMRSDPAFAAKSTIQKALLYWRMWLHPAEHGTRAVLVSAALLIGLFVVGGLGLVTYRDRGVALCVLAFFLAMWLAHVPYIPTLRLRTPLTDPLLIAFASAPLATLVSRRRRSTG